MANKKKLNVASTQANKLIAELPEIFEPQKRVNYLNEFDRLQGAKRLTALQPDVKTRMEELQNKARQSLKGEAHNMYKTKL